MAVHTYIPIISSTVYAYMYNTAVSVHTTHRELTGAEHVYHDIVSTVIMPLQFDQ